LEISTRRDRRARHRRRATFGAAVVFVAVAVVAALYRRGSEAGSDAAEWLASGIVVALGALAAATH
jgi:4-amino-4-deoxy-L-arabinose transferase-like glycosyltransferase